ncbi:sulfurtransferase TusA family protein [bacterium]|jgi:TusA-related sulfurtransferase|nr:sulfurtransferase TusA family protein [Pirellulales bacterium]NBP80210.1 sulfurtransferase TusA family protein [bacterium]
MANVDLDCAGLSCPVPIVRISRAMKEMSSGDTLTVTASDPSFQADVEAWVRKMGHQLESFSEADGTQTAVVRHA